MALLPKTPSPLLPAIVLLALVASASAASLTVETHRHEPGSVGAAPHDLPHRNLTLGGGSDEQQLQPIVFHHVYNINVPPGSLCAVDLDAGPPDGAGFDSRSVVGSGSGDGDIGGGESDLGTFTQKTHETGGQVVFTHRISIPKRACGCSTEGLPDLRELVRRVELMEQEISSLRQQCSSAACCGAAPGAVDIASPCNGHGTFSTESCGCVCDKGWTGKTCSQPACPSDCGGRGTCVDGVCDCEEGFGGPDCGQATCLNDCSNRGVCVNGVCVCERGFVGADCSQPGCPNDCNGRGRCVDGKCLCARGFSGEDCRESRCPNNCNNRGRCVNGRCVCQKGYGGEDCGEGGACANDCSDRGKCVAGRCVCEPGFTGPECSVLSCPNDCNGHGFCDNGICVCDKGFVGEDCSTRELRETAPPPPAFVFVHRRLRCRAIEMGSPPPITVLGVMMHVVNCAVEMKLRNIRSFIGPKEMSFNYITESSVQVGWAALPFPVESWEITFTSEDSPDGLLSTLSSTETSHTQTGLKPGVKYDVSLVAIKDNKKSQLTTSFFSTLIDSPKDLKVDDVKDTTAQLSWTSPSALVDGLVLTYGPTRPGARKTEVPLQPTVTEHALQGLRPGVHYIVILHSVRGPQMSDKQIQSFVTGIDGAKNLQVVSVTDSTMDIEWENTQSPIDHYTVHYSTSSGDPPGDIKVYKSPQPTTKTTITGLQPGTEYKISVVALKGNKGSAPASTTGRTVIDGPKDLQVTNSSDTTISLSWTAPSTSFDRYTITFASETSDDGREVTVPADATTATLSDLEPGTKYAIRLRAEKGSVHSAWAFTSGKTGCKPATAMRFSDITPTSLVASWASPPATPDYYIVKYSQRNREPHTVAVSGGQNYVVLSDLKPDTEYRVRVISVKGVSSSKPLIGDVFTAIETPRNIDFKDIRETSVVVTWIAPSADADSFKIAYVPTAGGEPESRRVASSLTEVMLTRLTPGTEYEVNVISVKSFQESDPLTGTFTTLLGSPSVLSAEDVTDSSALLKWKPTIGPVDTYSLTYSFEDGEPVTVTVSGGTVEYQLTDLNPDTPYVAKVRAVKGAQQSADTAVAFVTARKKTSFPMDCSEALQGDQSSGVFTIFLNGNASQPLLVYCDMTTDGGGWIVVQRRQNGLTDFFRNWKAYEKGFGDINDEFWLGLQNIFALTSQGRYELRVDLRDGEWGAHAVYDHFSVANASGLYRLKVGEYSGTAGDSMTYHQGRPFSTVDRDNDVAITNCAISYHGAWWYKNCHRANLNGKYGDKSHSQGVNWYHWKGHEYSVPFVEMKIRPFAAAKRGSRQHLRN
ncbi:unnamed protein product [Lampetra planeri]